MSKSVLIVDDDAEIRRFLGVLLGRCAYEVEEASNGVEAIERIRARRHDAILLDLMMGPGSGFEVLAELESLRPAEKCVVVLSASSEGRLQSANGPNVSARIRKPFDLAELVNAVRACGPQSSEAERNISSAGENSHTGH